MTYSISKDNSNKDQESGAAAKKIHGMVSEIIWDVFIEPALILSYPAIKSAQSILKGNYNSAIIFAGITVIESYNYDKLVAPTFSFVVANFTAGVYKILTDNLSYSYLSPSNEVHANAAEYAEESPLISNELFPS